MMAVIGAKWLGVGRSLNNVHSLLAVHKALCTVQFITSLYTFTVTHCNYCFMYRSLTVKGARISELFSNSRNNSALLGEKRESPNF